jgi:tetratricopeptide (TPR) repeat protein
MLQYKRLIILVALIVLSVAWMATADTWRLGDDDSRRTLSPKNEHKYLLAVANTKDLVDKGRTREGKAPHKKPKHDFPRVTKSDLDIFIEAELLYSKGKYAKAIKRYDKLLKAYPESELCEAALDRQFTMAKALLDGRKITVLGIFKVKSYSTGVQTMERIIDRVGLSEPDGLGIKAALAVVEHYEKRKKYEQAYLTWSEISSQWQSGQIGKDALLGMARCKLAIYNKQPEGKRFLFDTSNLITARSYYEKFQLLYQKEAETLGVDSIIDEIDEQLALKQLGIGRYYRKIGKRQAANLYFDMVTQNWPDTEAAQTAKAMLNSCVDDMETENK